MNTDDTLSSEIAKILSETAVKAFKMPTENIISAFDDAEVECLSLVPTKVLELEVKRRVAEWKLRLHCDRDCSYELVDKLHNNILKLGYTNLESEGSTELYFAHYCIRLNKTGEARSILSLLSSKLKSELKTNDIEMYRHFITASENLLSKI